MCDATVPPFRPRGALLLGDGSDVKRPSLRTREGPLPLRGADDAKRAGGPAFRGTVTAADPDDARRASPRPREGLVRRDGRVDAKRPSLKPRGALLLRGGATTKRPSLRPRGLILLPGGDDAKRPSLRSRGTPRLGRGTTAKRSSLCPREAVLLRGGAVAKPPLLRPRGALLLGSGVDATKQAGAWLFLSTAAIVIAPDNSASGPLPRPSSDSHCWELPDLLLGLEGGFASLTVPLACEACLGLFLQDLPPCLVANDASQDPWAAPVVVFAAVAVLEAGLGSEAVSLTGKARVCSVPRQLCSIPPQSHLCSVFSDALRDPWDAAVVVFSTAAVATPALFEDTAAAVASLLEDAFQPPSVCS